MNPIWTAVILNCKPFVTHTTRGAYTTKEPTDASQIKGLAS